MYHLNYLRISGYNLHLINFRIDKVIKILHFIDE